MSKNPHKEWPHFWFGFFKCGERFDPYESSDYFNVPEIYEFIDHDWRYANSDKLNEYLRSNLLRGELADETSKCLLCDAVHSPSYIHWDGRWLWPASLRHYVEFHGVRLPDAMIKDIEVRDFISMPNNYLPDTDGLHWPIKKKVNIAVRLFNWVRKV